MVKVSSNLAEICLKNSNFYDNIVMNNFEIIIESAKYAIKSFPYANKL